ncbi:GLIPR1-like protein 1 [Haliotis rufescens]|uniref:GLIPR1-like protein 1 n=1 Tax=Haliotis rufescens TaxID=6454 RepID=UPI001EAFBCFB|nr:GLIPR1-like protein 1 [Haliotis rufescens]
MTSSAVVIFVSAVFVGVVFGDIETQALPGHGEFVKRVRRETDKQNTAITGFSAAEKQNIVDKHNEYRRIPNAADMLLMSWDNELEALAQGWAAQCKFAHNPNRTIASSTSPIGENLSIKAPSYNEVSSVTSWYNEVSDYTYSSNTCSATCGHYTQVIWASSYKIGCGIKFCSTIEGSTITNGYVVICNYLPAGNFRGEKPYKEGASCSQCPADRQTCENKLCRESSGSGGSGTTPTSTTSSNTAQSSSRETTTRGTERSGATAWTITSDILVLSVVFGNLM